jgi:hypothetical protein
MDGGTFNDFMKTFAFKDLKDLMNMFVDQGKSKRHILPTPTRATRRRTASHEAADHDALPVRAPKVDGDAPKPESYTAADGALNGRGGSHDRVEFP